MAERRPGDWTICDMQVSHEGRGVGSLLLQEAISVARAHDASILRGFVIREDYEQAPFLLDWYSRYGFEVHSNLVTDHDNDTVAIFRMVL
jgi:GNAT superfamily N-acetyltransferase